MIRALALISVLAMSGRVLADELVEATSVVTLTLPSLAAPTLHASVITTIGDATSYLVGCPSGAGGGDPETTNCHIPDDGIKALQGPGTLSWVLNHEVGLAFPPLYSMKEFH